MQRHRDGIPSPVVPAPAWPVADFDRVVGGLPSRRRPVVVGSCLFRRDLHGLCVRRDLLLFLRRFHCFLVSTGTDVWIIEVEIETEWPMLLLVEQQAQMMLETPETGSGRYYR